MLAFLKKLLLFAGALLLSLLVAEGLLHWRRGPVVLANFTPVPEAIREESKWDVPYVLKPGGVGVQEFGSDPRGALEPGARRTYRINSLGFRGPETTKEKPDGTFRIVGLGDSFTFGTGVRAEDTFLAVLERELADVVPGPVEVLNLGVMGYDTYHEVELLQKFALRLDPDMVVLCMFLNDAGGGSTHQHFTDAVFQWAQGLRRHSHLLDGLLARIERTGAQESAAEAYRKSFQGSDGWKRAKQALMRARSECRKAKVPLVLVVFPVLFGLGDYPLADVHKRITRFGESGGLPVMDLAPAFVEHDGPELWVHPTNQHPNEAGHRIAGRALARFLVDEGLTPKGDG